MKTFLKKYARELLAFVITLIIFTIFGYISVYHDWLWSYICLGTGVSLFFVIAFIIIYSFILYITGEDF